MPFRFHKTEIEGLTVIEPHQFADGRGVYRKYYEKNAFAGQGIDCEFTEGSEIVSGKGVLRGLHFQTVEAQAKLLRVVRGAVFDAAVDLRDGSPTFGRYHAELLDAAAPRAIYIPAGFAHGFLSLAEDTIFSYQCSGRYVPEVCGGLRWDDPALGIPWPLGEYGIGQVILTERDRNWPSLAELRDGKKGRRE